MEAISVDFAFARGMLNQLRRPIRAARYVLERKWPRFALPPPSQPSECAIDSTASMGLVPTAAATTTTTWVNEPMATTTASMELDESFMFEPEGIPGVPSIWEDVNYWTTMNTL
jgi:hypothetical protein